MYRNFIMSSITFRKGMIKKINFWKKYIFFQKFFCVFLCHVVSCRVLYKTHVSYRVLSCHILSFGQSSFSHFWWVSKVALVHLLLEKSSKIAINWEILMKNILQLAFNQTKSMELPKFSAPKFFLPLSLDKKVD